MAVNYTITIRGSSDATVQASLEAFVDSLRKAGHQIQVANLETSSVADCSPTALDAKAEAVAAGIAIAAP